MKKIALLLVLALAFGALFACGQDEGDKVKTAAEVIAEAEEKLFSSRVKMVIDYSFATDNAMLQTAINAAMPTTEMIIDGDNQYAKVKMPNVTGIGADFIETDTTIVGDKVYVNASGVKTVTTLDPVSLELLLKQKSEETVDFTEFIDAASSPEMVTDGDKVTITFTALKDGKSFDSLIPGLADLFKADVSISNMKGEFVVNNGNIEKYAVSYDISAEGESINCKCEYVITTEGVPAVTAPADAENYIATPSIPGFN